MLAFSASVTVCNLKLVPASWAGLDATAPVNRRAVRCSRRDSSAQFSQGASGAVVIVLPYIWHVDNRSWVRLQLPDQIPLLPRPAQRVQNLLDLLIAQLVRDALGFVPADRM